MTIRRTLVLFSLLALASADRASAGIFQAREEMAPYPSATGALGLPAPIAAELQQAIDAHDYIAAEKILLAEIDRDPRSPSAARMLAFTGTVYFLNHDYLNAAIAWKKSDAITPLDPSLRFSLAMTYVRIGHPDWARTVLISLATENPTTALYPYWLGRLDYDGHEYNGAIRHFQHAIELDPRMARAYGNLGLCYYYQNENELAVTNYKKAIALNREGGHPSAWPYLNLAITQQFLNELSEAEQNLHEALDIDPRFAKAHFQLGSVLEDQNRLPPALEELKAAARLDPSYPEPHMAMARIYHKLGQETGAREEVEAYLKLRPHTSP